jgi:molybdopterin-guanine dinucleotide biosynthesis protein A
MSAALQGLVLTGGHSRRMARDKAALEYGGRSQLERAMSLLTPLVGRSFVSLRPDQLADPQRASYPCIIDLQPDLGPIGGIHAALHAEPDCAWLVLACDLPFLDTATLQQLIAERAPEKVATAFLSDFDGKPEPVCAIYEPAARALVDSWIASGQRCPRALLGQSDIKLLPARSGGALANINTSEEYLRARAQLAPARTAAGMRKVNVQYFAILREQAGRAREELETSAQTALELYEELRIRHGLKLAPEQLRVAINEEFADMSQPLSRGDTVVFLPPVAGG